MLDIHFIREHHAQVAESIRARRVDVSLDELVGLADKRSAFLQNRERLQHERRVLAKQVPNEGDASLRERGKEIKGELAALEEELRVVEERYWALLQRVPNILHPEVPIGECDDDNRVRRSWGEAPSIAAPRDHVDLGNALDLFDFEGGARVSGAKFYYLKNEAVLLEMALIRFACERIAAHGYTLHTTPDMVLHEVARGLGYSPRGNENESYLIEGTKLCLVATSEITLGGLYAGEIIEEARLPLRLGGFSHCFRREAGAAGHSGKGLYRVHQFSKVEMFVICEPPQAEAMLDEIVMIEEEIFRALEIPYRVLDMCSGDLGAQHCRKFDLEAWMPGRGGWGEVTSASNCTDYQARRLKIRYRHGTDIDLPYMLNGTAVATTRAILALLENHQHPDGAIVIPKALQPYTGFSVIEPKNKDRR